MLDIIIITGLNPPLSFSRFSSLCGNPVLGVDFDKVLVSFIFDKQMLQIIYLRLTCDWTLELLSMACNRSFNMLNILFAIL